jgi:hypothetical protein
MLDPTIKDKILGVAPVRAAWSELRSRQLVREYRARRERYRKLAKDRALVYSEEDTIREIRARLRGRGYTPAVRGPGEVHTFAFIPLYSWHGCLVPDLHELGPVTLFDYKKLGFDPPHASVPHEKLLSQREEVSRLFVDAVRAAHKERPIDWVFVYAHGLEISAWAIRAITEELGIPTVNMCLDDKQSWEGPRLGDQRMGQIDIGPAFDISWTSATVACEWYLVEGARPIYMPEAFDQTTYGPRDVPRDVPVSFVGACYGFRPALVNDLIDHGVDVHAYGRGWPRGGIGAKEAVDLASRSIINLGMGGIGYSDALKNVKTRDFEIPGAGGGAYLTTFNPDLAKHFVVGEEILCYSSRDELLELLRYYLAHPDEAAQVAKRGRERCLREHRWVHRYQRVLELLGAMA